MKWSKPLGALLLVLSLAPLVFAQRAIDVHTHIIPEEYIRYLQRNNALLEEGFPIPAYDAGKHLAWMGEAGVTLSVLSLVAPHPYFGNAEESAREVRLYNELSARLAEKHPERFRFCATLPLPDISLAIAEAKYALDSLGAVAVKLATNVRGQYLGSPELDELMEVLNERDAVIILHPHRPTPANDAVVEQTPLAMQEYLSETTRAVTNMISRNLFARFPRLKLVVPHCGAYLPLAIPRMKALAPVMQQAGLVGEIDWERNLSALYYDLAGAHSPETIRMMLSITTPEHLLYGSDYPYAPASLLTQSLERMRAYLAKEADLAPYREMILSGNATRLFRLNERL